eukprot:TRINITY_DN4609_c0_g1_i2.p1 TRINITY_DN4609_c0_g1~~TRINITY_DN4609_c0_g1_i2.p1  ORF type:complete len:256 (+),score=34.68 TRINITY_DN4609_c0_g1_i2:19-786(+)
MLASSYGTDDPRLGKHITQGVDGDIVIIGFPYDDGVARNGGRVGAARGPAVVREFIQKMGTLVNMEFNVDLRTIKISDGGDVPSGLELEEAHEQLRQKVSEVVSRGGIPFVIGGGNDQSFANASGWMMKKETGSFGVINIDAHLDVRPLKEGKVHSGSPFRLLLNDDTFLSRSGKFSEFAVQGSQCSSEHWSYCTERNVIMKPLSEIKRDVLGHFKQVVAQLGENIFVSFDLDSVSSADAPVCSIVVIILVLILG